MKKQDEPDFHKLDKVSPLPELEESQNRVNSNVVGMRRQGADVGGLPGGNTGGLPNTMSAMQSQMGQFGSPHSNGMPQGAGSFAFNPGMMGGKDAMQNMNAMLGADHLRAAPGMNGSSVLPPGFPGAPGPGLGNRSGGDNLGGGGGGGGGSGNGPPGADNQLFQLQRLRHLQHLQLFQRQVGAASLVGAEDLARIQAEHALGLRGRP